MMHLLFSPRSDGQCLRLRQWDEQWGGAPGICTSRQPRDHLIVVCAVSAVGQAVGGAQGGRRDPLLVWRLMPAVRRRNPLQV